MRHFKKKESPEDFENWKAKKNSEWEPSWGNFQQPEKNIVLKSLLGEQGYLCCYCGQEVDEAHSHIEHLIPRGKDDSLALEYGNLLCSCQPDGFIPKQPVHCGHKKEDWYEPELFVSPLMNGCEERFSYTALGEIYPTDASDIAAKKTIEVLDLDVGFLNETRKKLIEAFLDLSKEDLEKIISSYSIPRENNRLYPYCFVVTNFFRSYV
ncbi:MAG: retron system putative HNH endonuclease [Gallionella sp.]